MRQSVLVWVAVLSACTSTGGSVTPVRDVTSVRVVGPGGSSSLRVREDDETSTGIVAYPLETVWRSLPSVFDSLAVPITRLDTTSRIIGSEGYRVRQRLGRVPLSRYFDCGTTQVGANADSYEVFMVVLARVRPGAAGTTTVDVTIDARARPVAFSQGYTSCVNMGTLDVRFRELLRAQLAR